MFEAFINVAEIVGAAIFKLFPKSWRRKVEPDSVIGQAIGVVIGVLLLIVVMFIVYKVQE